MAIKHGVLSPEQIRSYKELHHELLEGVPFRTSMMNHQVGEYYWIRGHLNNILPSKKSKEEVRRNLYKMLKEVYGEIQSNITIIKSSIKTLNRCADKLNSIGAEKNVTSENYLYPYKYEKLDVEDYIGNNVKLKIKRIEKDPKTGDDKLVWDDVVVDIKGLATPEELYESGDDMSDLFNYAKPAKRARVAKRSKTVKRAKPTKRVTGNASSERNFGIRIIKNATKLSGTQKTLLRLKKI